MNVMIDICWKCKFAKYDDDLDFYEIRCEIDNKIHHENSFCNKYEFDPNYAKINPRVNI